MPDRQQTARASGRYGFAMPRSMRGPMSEASSVPWLDGSYRMRTPPGLLRIDMLADYSEPSHGVSLSSSSPRRSKDQDQAPLGLPRTLVRLGCLTEPFIDQTVVG